ncbi:MAG: efflux transporter outer membrane subunit [Mesonia hippocampi]|uniref:NodT family efflux transporter outer membrane factor (OMF) lipoprotein n=1 Tax=Mesonia hippocampi TaxID=1628250 RepID=A0A840EW82_9FLAO|nr:TolC family protein [Mesonia hippocampi]MBB4118324.1 NodT family efflux transporter outer membrane factor (OMF) lipoprotein [Mesonia hippocampi]
MKTRRIYSLFMLVSVPFLLVSCFAAKEYEQPDIVDETYFRTDQISTDSTSIADVSWKEIFTDPQLVSYIDKGLNNNIDIRVALQQIIAAEAYFKQGKAGYFPTLGANASVTHQELAKNSQFGSFFNGSIDQYELTGNLSWEADIWGKIRSQKRAFQASYLQTTAAHQAVKTQLVANIAATYYQLLAVDEQIKITQETIANRQNSVETTKALKDAGNVTEVGVKQTEAQLYTAQAILLDLKNQQHLLENTIAILLGEEPHAIERGELKNQEITTSLKTGVPMQLLSNRPDVVAAEYQLRNAFELTNVARSSFYPSLTLTASGGLQSLDLGDLFNTNSLFANIIGGLTQPIFNGRKIKTQHEVAKAQQEQARLQFRKAFLTATKEVSDALFAYETASEKILVKEKEFNAYKQATNYSEELLNYGLANYLEVLTAKENSLNSELGLIDAKFNQLKATIDLYKAVGGGWK